VETGLSGNQSADARGARKVDFSHGRVRNQGVDHVGGVVARVLDDVEHARGQTSVSKDLS
jgi:hypothetical protein